MTLKKIFFAISLNGLFLALTGCTSLNNKCDYIPPGHCWSDSCLGALPTEGVSVCRSFWSCGRGYHFQDR